MLFGAQGLAISNDMAFLPKGFVYLEDIDPTIIQDLNFATEENILGVPADGYESERVICTREAALALSKAQKDLQNQGLSLCVNDAYRPVRAVEHIQRWARDLNDQKTKARYYPDISKEEILGTFVAANKSAHSRGSTFDVILYNAATKEAINMGPDTFGEASFTYSSKITPAQQSYRLLLRKVMMKYGFRPYDKEFWHFTLIDEPFPKTYFNFPVR